MSEVLDAHPGLGARGPQESQTVEHDRPPQCQQKQIDCMDANALSSAVQKLNLDIQRISTRMRSSLLSAEAAVAGLVSNEVSHDNVGAAEDSGNIAHTSSSTQHRTCVNKLSDEAVDTNPYSRLMALQRMGVVEDYEKIRHCTVAVIGVGGVGSVAAEMLARCGIGRLLLYDYDTVELANMNRLFFRPQHVGMWKIDAASSVLAEVNPDVYVETFRTNITSMSGYDQLMKSLLAPETGKSRVNLVLSCVDNYEARIHINRVCLELQQVWMESGVSEDALSGHIQLVAPGKTACFECVPPFIVASGIDESTLKRDGACAASLPTSIGIVAGLLVHNALKLMLGFGSVTPYLGYSSLTDYFPQQVIKPNPECKQAACQHLQQAHRDLVKCEEHVLADQSKTSKSDAGSAVPHEGNDWNIELVSCEDEEQSLPVMHAEQQVSVQNESVEELLSQLETAQEQ